jgi:hypothetical protein
MVSLSVFAGNKNVLVLRDGKQAYLKNIVSYAHKSNILYEGKLTKEQEKAVGALVVTNGVVAIDVDALTALKIEKAAKQVAVEKKKQDKKDAKARLKASNKQEIKDLMLVFGE